MKNIFYVVILIFSFFKVGAQESRMEIVGRVTDTLGVALLESTILLLDPADSTLISYSKADLDGNFEFKRLKNQDYLLKISYIGYVNSFIPVKAGTGKTDVGTVRLKEISQELFQVVVKEARAPMTIRGDTIEYDASTFKVAPGSTVEDLIRRLPGMEVDATGAIKSEGLDVSKVTVDGKSFFGSDPKMATKNLPAEGIAKVQVFREVTEEEKITGNSREDGNRTMNLELKEEFKKGGFGKVIGGIGTEDRFEIKGNYNKFNDKHQFSLIGVGNNTGRNGLGWNDYQDFRGSQSFNFDDGTFGFGGGGGGGRRFVITTGGGGDLGISNSFFGSSDAGYPKNFNGGLNYNFDNKKHKFSGTYFYDYRGLEATAIRNQQVFLPDFSYINRDESNKNSLNRSHSTEMSYEGEIDSMTTLRINATGVLQNNRNDSEANLRLNDESGNLTNLSDINTQFLTGNEVARINAIVRRKFQKQGRSLGLSAGTNFSRSNVTGDQNSVNDFIDPVTGIVTRDIVNQFVESTGTSRDFKANAIYVEPLTKKIFWETFYNFSRSSSLTDRETYDRQEELLVKSDSLSRSSDNLTTYNRIGTSLRYRLESWNIQAGGAWQEYILDGKAWEGDGTLLSDINNKFRIFTPYVSIDYDIRRNKSLGLNYNISNNIPSFSQLQPIIDNSNPLYIREGNPDLLPSTANRVSLNFRNFNSVNFTNLFANMSYTYTDNPIINEEYVDENFVTRVRPINYKHSHSFNLWGNYGFPIVKNKFTVNVNYSSGWSRSYALVNLEENGTTSVSNRGGLRLNVTPNEKISFFLNSSLGVTDVRYSVRSSQNQLIVNQSYSLNFNTQLFWGLFFNSDFDYSIYTNERFGFDTRIPILNISLYKVFLKDNRGELRLSGYDIFDQNRRISQNASVNKVTETLTSNLSRYFMLTFTYNMRGISNESRGGGRRGGMIFMG